MSGPQPRYEPLEHTAEAGIIARGATLAQAFEHAAEGMYALVLNLDGIEEREEREITIEAASQEDLLVDFLLELVYLTETEGLVFRRFRVDELSDARLHAHAWGERFDDGRHRSHNVMVKAVTRHMLEITRDGSGYRVQVLFDI